MWPQAHKHSSLKLQASSLKLQASSFKPQDRYGLIVVFILDKYQALLTERPNSRLLSVGLPDPKINP